MQGITPPTVAQLLAAGQVMLAKLEIYVDSRWINLCSLPPEEGLIGYWPFNIGSGVIAYDHSGYDNDGSLENMEEADWVDGVVGKALDFDGGNDCVKVINATELDGNGEHKTVSAWIYQREDDQERVVGVFQAEGSPLVQYALFITGGRRLRIQLRNAAGAYFGSIISTMTFTLNEWHHIAFTYDETNLIFYLDGVAESHVLTGEIRTDPAPALYIGARGDEAGDEFFNGLIDEVRIYNRALTFAEIQTLYSLEIEGKNNYLESISVSLGGASMTPNPIGGKWNASLANEGSIFHPDHPTSAYAGYCVSGREVRITIGATYGGIDYYYQRIIGYMDEPKFSTPDYKVSISGQDYMKRLEDAEFQEMDGTHPNHWGLSTTFDSWPSDGLLGAEMYTNADAMDTLLEQHDVVGWTATNCNFVSLIENSMGSLRVGKMTGATPLAARIINTDIGTNAIAGRMYRVKFKHKIVGGDGTKGIRIQIHQTGLIKSVVYFPTDDVKEETLYFIATDTAAIEMRFYFSPVAYELWLDQISVWEYKPEEDRYYDLTVADANQKGPFYVTYDDGGGAVVVQQGEEDEGWWYEEATGHLFFDRNKTIIDGTGLNNVVVHYYTATDPEDAVARILWFAGLGYLGTPYANEAAALAAMDNDDPGFSIDKVWFKAGTSFLSAIKMLCEVCNYRFHFKYTGQPSFKAPPAGGVVFTFSDPSQIASQRTYQSRSEIKNRVIIKGIKRAEPVNLDDSVPSELIGDAADDAPGASIDTYGERTLTITNHLFQTQARIDAMCVTLRDLYKTPKWYANLKIPFNPVPLELGDEIQWEERLSHDLADKTQTGIIRDIKISNFITTYKVKITTP